MVRLFDSLMLTSILASGVAIAAPEFDQEAELRRSNCDNGCFDDSFPGGSCTNDPACMCNQNKYREAYFCCMANNCEEIVLSRSVERQHDECQARNLDFTFDAEKACGIKLAATTSSISSTEASATSAALSEILSTLTASITSDAATRTTWDKNAQDTAQTSSTGGATPVTDDVPQIKPALGVYSTPEWYSKAQDKDVSSDIGRLTIHHLGFKQAAEGTLVFAPLSFAGDTPRAILDVGTADGLWMRDVQSSIPESAHHKHTFVGTDINASFFPSTATKGITYVKQDIKDPPPQAWYESFDMINLRMVLIAAGSGDAQRSVVNEHIRLLKPGGWIQIGDCDRVCPTSNEENPCYNDMFACIRAVCQASGLDPLEAPKMKSWLVDAGLEEVQERTAFRSVGKRNADDELGYLAIKADLTIAKGFAAGAKALAPSVKPLADERLDTLVQDLEIELTETGAYFPMRFIWGRKPL
ncbi:s-adenosyl-l-methionine-dependent methyltransferase [Fusarium longipes]|uniref:S-adenosyl-l-methionine-dependent methyltransferase n=1 Tax=Fusarium longipes TaxID=694270 RepID=A0A395SL82_9HYPO|nr:s-adenosyl-l-methionine-dependent methyltransferase [Fusarium longipes]